VPATTVIPPGAGEIIGDAPDRRVEILCEHESLHVTWSRFGPRRDGADLHIHHHHTDFFYVLQGELTVRLGADGAQTRVPEGRLVRVPPGVIHGFRNTSDAELRYLNLHAPGCGFADYMRGLRDGSPVAFDQDEPPADGGRAVADAVIGEPAVDSEEIAIDLVTAGELGAGPDGRATFAYVLDGDLGGTWLAAPAQLPAVARMLRIDVPA
jgi:mannose-6-phosphate isomerase-like protein (cupin superfamily)